MKQNTGRFTVGEILAVLPEAVGRQVHEILSEPQDISEAAAKLKPLLVPHAAALEKIGVVAEFAAYALPYHVYKHLGD
jgi:hypothetical protein